MARTYHTFDLIILGGGTAGLSALKEAKKHSNNVLLVQGGASGTSCARTACMPSKALIHAANLYHSRHKMQDAGISGTNWLHADMPEILQKVREKRDHFVSSVNKGMKPLQCSILKGYGSFESPTKIRVGSRLLHAQKVVIATGSSPTIPAQFKDYGDRIITSDSLFEYKKLPPRMAVVGMGPVGMEMAQALARLGVSVVAIDRDECLGGISDPAICEQVVKMLRKEMRLWLEKDFEVKLEGNNLVLTCNGEAAEVDKVLVCSGRKPNLSKLGLRKLKVDVDEKGVPIYNPYTMQIDHLPIYLAGDVTDERAVLHEAVDEGKRAAYHAITGDTKRMKRKVPLSIVFTEPNIVQIGSSYHGLRHSGIIIGEASFEDQGRATIENDNFGKIRLFIDKADRTLSGAELLAPEGEHFAHLLALAIEQQLPVEDILNMPFYHPTFEEALKTALKQASRKLDNGNGSKKVS